MSAVKHTGGAGLEGCLESGASEEDVEIQLDIDPDLLCQDINEDYLNFPMGQFSRYQPCDKSNQKQLTVSRKQTHLFQQSTTSATLGSAFYSELKGNKKKEEQKKSLKKEMQVKKKEKLQNNKKSQKKQATERKNKKKEKETGMKELEKELEGLRAPEDSDFRLGSDASSLPYDDYKPFHTVFGENVMLNLSDVLLDKTEYENKDMRADWYGSEDSQDIDKDYLNFRMGQFTRYQPFNMSNQMRLTMEREQACLPQNHTSSTNNKKKSFLEAKKSLKKGKQEKTNEKTEKSKKKEGVSQKKQETGKKNKKQKKTEKKKLREKELEELRAPINLELSLDSELSSLPFDDYKPFHTVWGENGAVNLSDVMLDKIENKDLGIEDMRVDPEKESSSHLYVRVEPAKTEIVKEKREEVERMRQQEEMEEEMRKRTEKQESLRVAQERQRKQEEEEVQMMKEESQERIRSLIQQLERERKEEEVRLKEEMQTQLQQLREQAQKERETQLHTLREENERELRELRSRLDAELKKECEAERKQVQERRKEQLAAIRVEEAELNELKAQLETKSRELKCQELTLQTQEADIKTRSQLLGKELNEIKKGLEGCRDEVQKEHYRTLEQLKDEHRQELETIRETHIQEESSQRERLLRSLQEEKERLLMSHNSELNHLRLQLDSQLQDMRQTHTQKEAELQELMVQLEIKTKELTLQAQVADLEKQKQELCENEDEDDKGTKARLDNMKRKNDDNRRRREETERLQGEVDFLHSICDQLSQRLSALEQKDGRNKRHRRSKNSLKQRTRETDEEEEFLKNQKLTAMVTTQDMERQQECVSNEVIYIQHMKQFAERQMTEMRDRQRARRKVNAGRTMKDYSPNQRSQTKAVTMGDKQNVQSNITETDGQEDNGCTMESGSHQTAPPLANVCPLSHSVPPCVLSHTTPHHDHFPYGIPMDACGMFSLRTLNACPEYIPKSLSGLQPRPNNAMISEDKRWIQTMKHKYSMSPKEFVSSDTTSEMIQKWIDDNKQWLQAKLHYLKMPLFPRC